MAPVRLALSLGCPCGIGPEVTAQALATPLHLRDVPRPVQAFCSAFQAVNQPFKLVRPGES